MEDVDEDEVQIFKKNYLKKLKKICKDNNLFLKCKNCGFKEEQKNAVVITKVYKDSGNTTESNVNKYLIHEINYNLLECQVIKNQFH